MATPIDNNCATHTVALLKPGEVAPPDDSPFWCHGCRVRRHIATSVSTCTRVAHPEPHRYLQHLLEAFPCSTPVETW